MAKIEDTLGRKSKFYTEKDRTYRPRGLGRFFMEMLAWHGIANSEQLHQLRVSCGHGDDRDWTRKTLNNLYRGDLIGFDFEQYNYMTAQRSAYHIFNRTPHGDRVLEEWGKLEPFIRPSGNDFRHQYGIGSSTISIHNYAAMYNVTYRPGHELLTDTLRCKEIGYTPDQLFSLTYTNEPEHSDGYPWYIFALEFERSYYDKRTPEVAPRKQSKSSDYYEQKIKKIIEYIGKKRYKDHLNTNTAMLALFVFSDPEGERKFHDVLASMQTKCSFILTQTIPQNTDDVFPTLRPTGTWQELYFCPWRRHGYPDYFINTP